MVSFADGDEGTFMAKQGGRDNCAVLVKFVLEELARLAEAVGSSLILVDDNYRA